MKSVYDNKWYECNSREDPRVPEGGVDIGIADIDGKTSAAKRSKSKAAEYIAKQRPGGPHAPLVITNPPPPKLRHSGQWEFIEYIPEWTDPLWEDSKLEIDEGHPGQRLIRPHDLLRHLRPAQLPQDSSQNPTGMAKRYGIFPGRRDGRSRMTPTRTTFRKFMVNNVVRDDINGEFVWKQAENLARNSGLKGVDELLSKYSAMDRDAKAQVSEEDTFVLEAMQSMQDDEDWQTALFFGLNTNELIDDGIFSIESTFRPNLQNDIHEYLQRERWAETLYRGGEEDDPRLLYQTGKRKGEWNPLEDDYIWMRMQPALKLASRILRFLETQDPFWERLLDAFNRVPVGADRDDRPEEQRQKVPSYTFSMHEPDSETTPVAPDYIRAAVDIVAETAKLFSKVELSINSAYHDKGANDTAPTAGCTSATYADIISLSVSADSVWPLLNEGYSRDEYIMCCFMVASTLVHEIAHAVNYVHFLMLVRPGPVIIESLKDHPHIQEELRTIGEKLFGKTEAVMEPFFELEQRSEFGFCLESRLFGGTSWPILGCGPLLAKQLYFLPSGLMMRRWPTACELSDLPSGKTLEKNPSSLILKKPNLPANSYHVPVRLAQIKRLFTEQFWQTEVPRFGTAALHLCSDTPRRIMPPMDETLMQGMLDLVPDEVNAILFPEWPDGIEETSPIVSHFVNMIALEYIRLTAAKFEWQRDYRSWFTRHELSQQKLIHMIIMAEEARIAWYYRGFSATLDAAALEEWKATQLGVYRRLFPSLAGTLQRIRPQLPEGSEKLSSDVTFWDNIEEVAARASPKIGALLRLMHDDLVPEVYYIQTLYLAIFKLSDAERPQFSRQPVIKYLPTRIKDIAAQLKDVLFFLDGIKASEISVDVADELHLKFTTLAETLAQLRPYADDICQINPANWTDLLPIIPNIHKARRPAAVRLVKLAQREIELLPTLVVEELQKFLHTLDKVKLPPNMIDFSVQTGIGVAVDKLEKAFSREFGVDVDKTEDPASPVLKRRKREDDDEQATKKRVKYTYAPVITTPTLRHASPLASLSPSRTARHNRHRSPPRFSAVWEAKAVNNPIMQQATNVFTNIPDVTFPQAPPGHSGLAPAVPAALPVPAPMFPDPAQNPAQGGGGLGPQPIGIFPGAYSFAATFTEDLVYELQAREEAARQNPPGNVPLLHFTTRPEFVAQPRSPPGSSPQTPGSERRFWGPEDDTPPLAAARVSGEMAPANVVAFGGRLQPASASAQAGPSGMSQRQRRPGGLIERFTVSTRRGPGAMDRVAGGAQRVRTPGMGSESSGERMVLD